MFKSFDFLPILTVKRLDEAQKGTSMPENLHRTRLSHKQVVLSIPWLLLFSIFVGVANSQTRINPEKAPNMEISSPAPPKDGRAGDGASATEREIDLGKIFIDPVSKKSVAPQQTKSKVKLEIERLEREKIELKRTLERLEAKIRRRQKRAKIKYYRACV